MNLEEFTSTLTVEMRCSECGDKLEIRGAKALIKDRDGVEQSTETNISRIAPCRSCLSKADAPVRSLRRSLFNLQRRPTADIAVEHDIFLRALNALAEFPNRTVAEHGEVNEWLETVLRLAKGEYWKVVTENRRAQHCPCCNPHAN